MKRIVLSFIMLVIGCNMAFPKTHWDFIARFDMDTTTMFKMIRSSFDNECNRPLSERDDVCIYPFYLLTDSIEHTKSEYQDYSFLEKLIPKYQSIPTWYGNKQVIGSSNQVLDINGYIVADTQGHILGIGGKAIDPCCYQGSITPNTVFVKFGLFRLLHEHKMDFVFKICHGWPNKITPHFYYGISYASDELFVIVDTRYGTEFFALEEILDYHWEDFQNGLPKLYEEVRQRKMIEYENSDNN